MLNKNSPIVVQSNSLIESRYSITLGEQRLLLAMISLIHPDDIDFKPYILNVQDLAKFLNVDIKNAYREADKITDRLMKRILHIPQSDGSLLKVHWVSSARHSKGAVILKFDPDLKPYLIQLKEQFTQYRLTIAAQFKSMYTIRIYTLLKQYEKIGVREFNLNDLRDILGIKRDEYREFKEFRRRVINQAKKEFETKVQPKGTYKSDLSFDIENIREGRKISRIRFIIKKQSYQNKLPLKIEEESKILMQLKFYGISISVAEKILKEYQEEQINDAIILYDKVLSAGKVKNKGGGYLVALIKNGAGQENEIEKKIKTKKEEEKKRQEKLENNKKKVNYLKSQHLEVISKEVDHILINFSEEEKNKCIDAFLNTDLMKKTILVTEYRKKGLDSSMIKYSYRKFIAKKYLLKKIYDFKFWANSQKITLKEIKNKPNEYIII